jgi:hypothetical protein
MQVLRADQPGSAPIVTPDVIPNPAVVPKRVDEPARPREPQQPEPTRREPAKTPEKV